MRENFSLANHQYFKNYSKDLRKCYLDNFDIFIQDAEKISILSKYNDPNNKCTNVMQFIRDLDHYVTGLLDIFEDWQTWNKNNGKNGNYDIKVRAPKVRKNMMSDVSDVSGDVGGLEKVV